MVITLAFGGVGKCACVMVNSCVCELRRRTCERAQSYLAHLHGKDVGLVWCWLDMRTSRDVDSC